MWRLLLLALSATASSPGDKDGESSRKILGSSVVTSVSVIMDAGNGSKIYADAVGKPVSKPHTPGEVASPIELLSPDRYEFYTFDDAGDLVKRLMTLEEIHDIIATGDEDGLNLDSFASDGFVPEKRVNDVVNNVQNVLKEEIKMHKNPEKPLFDTPDVSSSWSMILPAVFGNSGDDIKPEPPIVHVTPDTIMVEPTTQRISTTEKVMTLQTKKTTPTTTTTTTEKAPMINVEIITNSNSTTERTVVVSSTGAPVVEIKPEGATRPSYHVSKSTKRPGPVKVTTFRPTRSTTTPEPTTMEDALAQPSTVFVEKVLTTSTELPTTPTELPETPSTTEPATSTFAPLSTFFTINDDRVTDADDLSTLSTEYVTVNTTEAQSTDRTSTVLDQFLLSSTNIYEINSELSNMQQTTDSFDSMTSSEEPTTEKFLIRLANPTEEPTTTTDRTFLETIEELISQAVGTPAPAIEAEKEAAMVQEVMLKSSNKTMPEIMAETATVASSLVGVREATTLPTTTVDNFALLSESVESLLSQIYAQGSTTVEYDTPTTVFETTTTLFTTTTPSTTTTTTTPSTTTTMTTPSTTTTTTTPSTTTTTTTPSTTTTMTTPSTTTTATTPSPTTTPTTTFEPHIINITVIRNENRNQTKPAKSDLSLEQEYENIINELKKNSSLTTPEIPSTTPAESTTFFSTTTEDVTTTDFTTVPTTTTTTTTTTTSKPEPPPSIVITINETKKNSSLEDTTWTLVSTVAPHSDTKHDPSTEASPSHQISSIVDPATPVDLVPKPLQGFGLEDSTAKLDTDIYQFVQLCNELAFGFWKSVTTGISSARSVVVSPFAATSLLAMVFLGARGATSGEMNEILKLDDMVTFNPHLIFKNVSESIEVDSDSGVAASAIIRELYSDRSKGKLLGFYKERVRQFYDGHVEEAGFREIGDVIRRRTNLLVKKNTDGKISEFLRDGSVVPKPPLAGLSVSIFQTDCADGSTAGRDGELHFIVLPSIRQRRLIPIPATVYRSGFLAGYEPSLDATAAALGQQGMSAPGDGLARLEKRLVESSFKKGAWSRLLRALIPRPGLELQIPRFQHRSVINATQSLKRMGLHDLFDAHKADLKGLNGAAHELHLSDVVQINDFATCGEKRIGETHHREVYPATAERTSRLLLEEWEEPRDYQRAFHDPLHDPSYLNLPLSLRPRQARLPEAPRLRFDRPFLYFVRHNPSGLILHMGRFHPRLMP